jgi:MarR family transcriptional regulator, organic hydroperoxide resistance regulator
MFDLAEFLPYLVNRAGALMAREFARALEPLGLVLNDWRVLAALLSRAELRMSELAEITSIDRTTLSRIVGRMSEADLVARSRPDEDAREVRVDLTDHGRKVATSILPLAHHYEQVSLAGLSPEEARQLKAMLTKVFANLEGL